MGIKIEGASRGDIFGVDFESIVFAERGEPLYDERVEEPLTDEFIENIARNGYLQPAGARNLGDGKVKLIWGRRRARALPHVNALRAKEGWGPPLRLPVVIRGNKDTRDEDLAILSVTENENRAADGLYLRATKAKRLLDYGHPTATVRSAFGLSRDATLLGWLKILSLDATTLEALRRGEVSDSAAIEMAQLSDEERAELVNEAKAKGAPVSTAMAREKVSQKKGVGRASAARKKLCEAALAHAHQVEKYGHTKTISFAPLVRAALAYARTQKKSRRDKAAKS